MVRALSADPQDVSSRHVVFGREVDQLIRDPRTASIFTSLDVRENIDPGDPTIERR